MRDRRAPSPRATCAKTDRRTPSARSPRRSTVLRRPDTERSRCARCRPAAAANRCARARPTSSSPAATMSSLFATATSMPRSTAAKTASNATEPSVAASTIVRFALDGNAHATRRGRRAAVVATCGVKAARPVRVTGRRCVRPRTRRPRTRRGCCAITSSACVPIEPVDPRIATRLRDVTGPAEFRADAASHKNVTPPKKIRIEAVEHAAMPLDHRAGIFDAGIALERRLDEIADLRGDARRKAQRGALPPLEVKLRDPSSRRCRPSVTMTSAPSEPSTVFFGEIFVRRVAPDSSSRRAWQTYRSAR